MRPIPHLARAAGRWLSHRSKCFSDVAVLTICRKLDGESCAELERSGFRDSFELVTRWAVQPLDLLRGLRRLKPTVVHFSGHGGRGAAG